MTKRRIWQVIAAFCALLFGLSLGQTAQAAVPQNVAPASSQTTVIGGSVGAQIVNAAYAQVGVTQDCTMLVTNSLAAVGINFHDWPVGYTSLGYAVSPSQALPGDLLYYADGGAGWAHIAVYAGNGQAIHGGFNGDQTVVFSVNVGYGIPPTQYIRVTGGSSANLAPAAAPAAVAAPAPAVEAPAMVPVSYVTPASPGGVHIVAAGESLSSIAAAAGLSSWQPLWDANPQISDPNLIYVGQAIVIPT